MKKTEKQLIYFFKYSMINKLNIEYKKEVSQVEENSNKDFLREEQKAEAENSPAEDTNSLKNTTEETQLSEEGQNAPAPVKAKRKCVIQISVLVAAGILLCALIVFGVCKIFFDNSIVGTWIVEGSTATNDQLKTEEEAVNGNTYYIFTDEKDKDGNKIAKLAVGTMELTGTYDIINNDDGTQKLSVSISYFFTGEYDFKVSGNALTGKVLTLSSDNGDFNFLSASKPKVSVEKSDDFKVNKDIVGEWNESDYNITYIFNEDGTAHVNEGGTLTVDGTYVVDDSKITITYLASQESTLDIEYSLDGDTLVLSGLGYTKVK